MSLSGFSIWLKEHIMVTSAVVIAILLIINGLRSCAGLQRHLPADVVRRIEERYIQCIDNFPIFPGERRQPECGQVRVQVTSLGVVPPSESAAGITKAVCYEVIYTNPSITTQGNVTTHDISWNERTSRKVAVMQSGEWLIFPDQEQQDRERWQQFACQ